jgi:hypothetical protein
MKPLRIVLDLAAIACFGTGIIATFNQSVPLAGRVGPHWFQAASMYGGTAALLVGVVAAIASARAGARPYGPAGPRGLLLGRRTLRLGTLSLVAGLLSPVLMFLRLMPPVLFFASLKLAPILIAIGAVLLRGSAVALGRADSHPPRILTLGEATLRTGLVLLLLGWSLPKVIRSVDQGLGMLGTFIEMDSLPAGLALLILGACIQAPGRSSHQGGEAVGSSGPCPDPA